MQSTSAADGTYVLTVTFAIGTDLNFAQVLVQNRVSAAMASLPTQVQVQGVVVQQKSTSILEIISLRSPDASRDSLYLSNYAAISLVNELARVPGVGNVVVFGVSQYAMRIWLDPDALRNRGLTPGDVIGAIQQQSQQVTSGQIGTPPAPDSQNFQYTVNVEGRLADPAQFADIIVKINGCCGSQITRVKDVGRVELGAQTYSQSFALDGKAAAGIAIFQLPDANALDKATRVNTRMAELAKSFPSGVVYDLPFDTTRFVKASIFEVYRTLIEAAVLVLIVILVFLQDWRAMLVPATTVPVTIIGAFAAMAALGFTVNLSTLFAIVLAIGIVVDDAIVVVEGAAHHIERGLSPHDAAITAMSELLFGPSHRHHPGVDVGVHSGRVPSGSDRARMCAQFALVIAATAIISAINAATLKPTRIARWAARARAAGAAQFLLSRLQSGLRSRRTWLRALCRPHGRDPATHHGHPGIDSGDVGVWGVARLPTAFIPIEDQGYFIVAVQLPDGASLGRTQRALEEVSKAGRRAGSRSRRRHQRDSHHWTTVRRYRTPVRFMSF